VKTQEFNILYKIDKNISFYTGIIKASSSITGADNGTITDYPYSYTADAKNAMQFGLIGNTKIGAKTTAYASFAVASDITDWKIGVSQQITPNLEFNLDYRNIKVNDISYTEDNANYKFTRDVTSKGLGYGITHKF